MSKPTPSTVDTHGGHEPTWSDWAYIPASPQRPQRWDRWCWEPYCGATQTSFTQPKDGGM